MRLRRGPGRRRGRLPGVALFVPGGGLLGRFRADVRGEGTGTSAVRIAVWTVIALAVAGLVGPSVYRVAAHTASCADAAASGGTGC